MTTRIARLYREEIALTRIDWRLLAQAIDYYEKRDFEYVELPYFVPSFVSDITFDGNGFNVDSLHSLIGSAEQSFLNDAVSCWRDKDMAPGRYVGCTPCFRKEPEYNALSQPHFMKVELFQCGGEADAWALMQIARQFMVLALPFHVSVLIETTSDGWDLVVNGVEVGSYGVRKYADFSWAYGTGLALPRFSKAQTLA